AHPEAKAAVSGEQVADRLEHIDARHRLGFAVGHSLFDQRSYLRRNLLEAPSDQRGEAVLVKAATFGGIRINSIDDPATPLDEGLLEPRLLLGRDRAKCRGPKLGQMLFRA